MKNSTDFTRRHRGTIARLNLAFAAGDEAEFEAVLGGLFDERRAAVLSDVARLSESLVAALTRFRSDSCIAALASREIPDAKLRLDHVLTMTEKAAHKTLDLIEASVPLANATVRDAGALMASLDDRSHNEIRRFLDETRGNFEAVRANLSEVMLTQSYQDLTGQILRGAQILVGEVEKKVGELARITGVQLPAPLVEHAIGEPGSSAVAGTAHNPITTQTDVDNLMADLGI